jgi:DNA-binding transcriptional LysR family regulator
VNKIQLQDVDFNLLKVLDTLAREVSIARTARRLGVTPSAISHALARLRRTLKDPLVVRSGRSLRLTPRALALAPIAASICEAARGVLSSRAAARPADWQETLRFIGSDYALTTWVFPAMIAARAEGPPLATCGKHAGRCRVGAATDRWSRRPRGAQ